MKAAIVGSCIGLVPRPWLRRVGALVGKVELNEIDLFVDLGRALSLTGVMVDVGARYGTSLAPYARSGWQVLAFEPDEKNRKVLNALRFWTRGVEVDDRAVSDENRTGVPFFTSEGHSSISSLLSFDSSHAPTTVVEVVTLEEALEEHSISEVTVLKVDAEGNDLRVLRGLDLNGPRRPKMIMCEFDGNKVESGGHTYRELGGFLETAGYRILVSEWYPISGYGGKHSWRDLQWWPHEIADPKSHGNLIAIDRAVDLPSSFQRVADSWASRMGS